MPELNSALFEPLTRIENACRRASNIMLNAPSLPPRENELMPEKFRKSETPRKHSRPRSKLRHQGGKVFGPSVAMSFNGHSSTQIPAVKLTSGVCGPVVGAIAEPDARHRLSAFSH
jgi:hypothetical protein